MYKRLYSFFKKSNVIYNLQFIFRQQYSISHALINITENIRKALDNQNIGCGVFVDLQKALCRPPQLAGKENFKFQMA